MSQTTVNMSGLVGDVVTGLRTVLTCPVEQYWRIEPPAVLTCFVQPNSEPGESGRGIGPTWISGFVIDVYLEVPWDDKVTTGTNLSSAVETVKAWVAANRALVVDGSVDYVTKYGEIKYMFLTRPGAGKPAFAAKIPIIIEWPK